MARSSVSHLLFIHSQIASGNYALFCFCLFFEAMHIDLIAEAGPNQLAEQIKLYPSSQILQSMVGFIDLPLSISSLVAQDPKSSNAGGGSSCSGGRFFFKSFSTSRVWSFLGIRNFLLRR